MRDPFFKAPIPLVQLTQPLANSLSLRTLPLHAHEISLAFCTYQFVKSVVAPRVSGYLFPETYAKLSKRARINWDVHFVSMVQACAINSVALWIMYMDVERRNMDWKERVWSYSGATGMVQGFSAGYFLWDLLASIKDIDVHGPGALAHAACALAVSSLGFVSLFRSIMCHDDLFFNLQLIDVSGLSLTTMVLTSFFTSCQPLSSTFTGSLTSWA